MVNATVHQALCSSLSLQEPSEVGHLWSQCTDELLRLEATEPRQAHWPTHLPRGELSLSLHEP